jgi:hypothetical protein
MALVALAGLAGTVALLVFLTLPVSKRRVLTYSAAQFASAAGGTKAARMGA